MFRISALPIFLCFVSFVGSALAVEQSEKHAGPAVSVHFDYYRTDYATVRNLEARLGKAIKRAQVGELSESELHLDGNDGYLYMYGPDPDRLYDVARPILRAYRLTANAEVTKWRGTRTETFLLLPEKTDPPSSGTNRVSTRSR
ncbi:hypothetical protein [Pandoraea sp. PE-S2T-3]|uniref:hypothetical protein n=1 Tax=Pandoraea sp. PE-S2T-3 TaxID=1986993 RepID=UPI0020CD632F|nr:hypothetical protein [Pandoraea sp. PE-S2T-3]